MQVVAALHSADIVLRSSERLRVAFVGCVGMSAFLLIVVQPIMAGRLLPSTGSNPYLWHSLQATCQLCLLVGYLVARRFGGRPARHPGVHYVVFLLGAGAFVALVNPLEFSSELSVLGALTVVTATVGVPIIALASFSVASQLCLASNRAEPTWLYAVSNCGSLAAAVAYPFLIEPFIGLESQLSSWRYATAASLLLCASVVLISKKRDCQCLSGTSEVQQTVPWRKRTAWILASAISVALTLAMTSYLALDLGSHPLVWMGPFSLYLATMAVAFSSSAAVLRRWSGPLGVTCAVVEVVLLVQSDLMPIRAHILQLVVLAPILFLSHVWVFESRPQPAALPTFYLCLVTGGIVGSLALALLGPTLFDPRTFGSSSLVRVLFGTNAPELLLLSVASVLLYRGRVLLGQRLQRLAAAAIWGAVTVVSVPTFWTFLLQPVAPITASASVRLLLAVVVVGGIPFFTRARSLALVCVVAALSTAVLMARPTDVIVLHTRTVFGQIKVVDSPEERSLVHGSTGHGSQRHSCFVTNSASECLQPSTYYAREGPLGVMIGRMQAGRKPMSVGVVGLGTGTVASYCRPGDSLIFYEIDPAVVAIATSYFGYLNHARLVCESVATHIGDGRMALRAERVSQFDFLIVDGFSSDSVPTHLMTVEAISEYMSKLRPDGVLAVHLSNRYYDLASVFKGNSARLQLPSVVLSDKGGNDRSASTWAFVSKDASNLVWRVGDPVPEFTEDLPMRTLVWTDDRHSLLTSLR